MGPSPGAPAASRASGPKTARRLARWLLNSDIQDRGQDPATRGGFRAWFDPDTGTYPYVYTETTGYGILALLFLHRDSPDERLLDRARLAADWILRVALTPHGGVRARYYLAAGHDDRFAFERGRLVTFDTGIVLHALVELHRATGDARYVVAAEAMAAFLLALRRPDGSIEPHHEPPPAAPPAEERWSAQPGAFHAKIAIGLLGLHRTTGDPRYREAARGLCEQALRRQQPDGRFVTSVGHGCTLQHPHLYAAEGLLCCGLRLSEPRFVTAARRAVEWSLGTQAADGGLPQLCRADGELVAHQRTDILAQALRLGAALHALEIARVDLGALARLRDRLLAFQAADGGIEYGYEHDGTRLRHVNSWCSMFALQALSFHDRLRAGVPPDLELLV